ncbi:hypothetical protein BACI349Y_620239 [Bacillus sp. 349Y]|nr:hypothetical protein BACI349Y_620239 [Bacillus sp. 349Y]
MWLATGLPPDFGAVYVMGGSAVVVPISAEDDPI